MDTEPFLVFNIEDIKDNLVNELRKFCKSAFDVDKIIDSASELKYSTAVRKILYREFAEPSEEFVRFFAKQIYQGIVTRKVLEQFTNIVKKAANQTFKDIVNDRLQSALSNQQEPTETKDTNEETPDSKDCRVVTTDDEIQGFHIVRAIVRQVIDASRIFERDTISYFGVLLDNNNRKPICRLHFNTSNKYISFFDNNRTGDRIPIQTIDDIYQYAERLHNTVKMYEDQNIEQNNSPEQ
jgi:predicted type IV restriction endonuclease